MKMRSIAAVSAFAVMLLSSSLGAQEKPEVLATRRTDAWLALVDQGKYEESWSEAARLFKGAVTREKWKEALAAARPPLGKLLSTRTGSGACRGTRSSRTRRPRNSG
jgi:hypothetical protein